MRVFDKLLQALKSAYYNKYPLIFIQTEEIEIIQRVIASDELVVRLKKKETEYETCGNNIIYAIYEKGNANIENIYIDKKISEDDKFPVLKVLHLGEMVDSIKKRDIMEFVDRYVASENDNGVTRSSLYLLYGDSKYLPNELTDYCAFIDVDLPEITEICDVIKDKIKYNKTNFNDSKKLNDLAYKLGGFSLVQVEKIVESIITNSTESGCNVLDDIEGIDSIIRERKKQILKKDSILDLKNPDSDLQIGGMQNFSTWFDGQSFSIKESGKLYYDTGVYSPKGVLMCGVPGCGKSMAAKAVSRKLNIPLLQMDVGKIMGSLVGESEKNMSKALKIAEAMSPCVLWIDELDKAFSNAGENGSSGDSGVFKRMFAVLLTWMQENTKPCFIFATANDISGMPKEFFRSGRFDALFSVFMPTRNECVEILYNQMQLFSNRVKKQQNKKLFDEACFEKSFLCKTIDSMCCGEHKKFLNGADIEKLVSIALRNIWNDCRGTELIFPDTWYDNMIKAISSTTIYGEGDENLNSIAMCYLKLLRNNFQSVSDDKSIVFDRCDYSVEYDENGDISKAGYVKRNDIKETISEYDFNLYESLIDRINRLATRFEKNMLMMITR